MTGGYAVPLEHAHCLQLSILANGLYDEDGLRLLVTPESLAPVMLMLSHDMQTSGVRIAPMTSAASLPLQISFLEDATGIMQRGLGEGRPQECLPQHRSCRRISTSWPYFKTECQALVAAFLCSL